MGVGHPASMGHGLNLQEGGYIGVFFGYLWDRELFDQFIRRLARQGQQNSVIIHIIFIDRKVEQVMAASLAKNGVVQDRIMNFMRVP
jgi:SNF2 family DNA or RNA helicase